MIEAFSSLDDNALRRELRTVFHESGHILAAESEGITWTVTELTPTSGRVTFAKPSALATVAGPVAEAILFGTSTPHVDDDLSVLRDLCELTDDEISKLRDEAALLITKRWQRLEQIAHSLFEALHELERTKAN